TLTLARLGREAPIAAASPEGPVLRHIERGSLNARLLYPEQRQERPDKMPRSPVIGTNAPVQYEPAGEEESCCRHQRRSSTSVPQASTARSLRSSGLARARG